MRLQLYTVSQNHERNASEVGDAFFVEMFEDRDFNM